MEVLRLFFNQSAALSPSSALVLNHGIPDKILKQTVRLGVVPFLKPPERPFSTGFSLLKALFDFKEIKFSKLDDKLTMEMVNFKDDDGFSLLARKTSNTMVLKTDGMYYLIDGISEGRLIVRGLDGASVDD